MGSDLRLGDDHDRHLLGRPVIAETMRTAASLRSPESSLQALIGLMIETGPWTAGSISLPTAAGELDTAAYLDARARDCDRKQFEFGEGPALDAMHEEPVQVSVDLAGEPRWARWSPVAAALGVRSTLTMRLFTDAALGTVNLYSTRPVRLDAARLCEAQVIAAHVSVVVAAMSAAGHLRRAMESRHVIGLAQGMLMQRFELTADRAFELLRHQSQQTNVKLISIARQIVTNGIDWVDVPDTE